LLNVSEVSYAELRDNDMIEEQSKIRSRSRSQMSVKVTDDSRLFFGATNVSLRCCCRCGHPFESIIWYRNKYELPQSRLRYWRYIYDVMEWSRGHSDYLTDHGSILWITL